MSWFTVRLYPEEFSEDSTNQVQNVVLRISKERYETATQWLKQHFKSRWIRILDIACGSGYGCEMLSELGEVVGVDMDPEVIEYANKTYGKKATTFAVGNADDADSLKKLGKFDAIVSIATLEHVADSGAYLDWIKHALKVDGIAVLCFPSCLTLDWGSPHHKRDISLRQARKLFMKNGLRIEKGFYQNNRLMAKDLIAETGANEEFAVPPVKQWIIYYLLHPHHLFFRIYELVFHSGFLYSHQQYLVVPES